MGKSGAKGKVKAPASVVNVPQSREAAAAMIAEIGQAHRHRARIEAEMNDALATTKAHYESLAAPHNDAILRLSTGVQTWCEANRDSLTQGGKVKFAAFTTGEVKWRNTPPSVALKGIETVIAALKRMGLQRFIREKEEVNKDAILAEPAAVKDVPGITIGSKEEFVIEPFDVKLDEVA